MRSDFEQLMEEFLELRRDHEDLKSTFQNAFRVGSVVARDKDKGVRLETGTEDEPHKSDWGQPAEPSGFQRRVPRVGEQCLFLAPFGDQGQGIVIPLTHNDANPNPASDVDEVVIFNHGSIKMAIAKDGKSVTLTNDKTSTKWEGAKITHTVDGNATTFEKDTITFPDGTSKVQHGARNIGKSHVHGGVKSGTEKTGDPDE